MPTKSMRKFRISTSLEYTIDKDGASHPALVVRLADAISFDEGVLAGSEALHDGVQLTRWAYAPNTWFFVEEVLPQTE